MLLPHKCLQSGHPIIRSVMKYLLNILTILLILPPQLLPWLSGPQQESTMLLRMSSMMVMVIFLPTRSSQ